MKDKDRVFVAARARVIALLVSALAVGSATVAEAQQGWSIGLEAVNVEVYGNDPHVLTIETVEDGVVRSDAVLLETDSDIGYRAEIQYRTGARGAGVDFFWVTSGQQLSRAASASGGEVVAFVVPGNRFSTRAGEPSLYFNRLDDTDMNSWAFDVYGLRSLGAGGGVVAEARIGLRVADFDNDYRVAVGIGDVEGQRIDASSNYGALIGPMMGLSTRFEGSRLALEGYLGQSFVFGEAELTGQRRTFTGPFSEDPDPAFDSDVVLHTFKDVVVPITNLRLAVEYRLWRFLSVETGLKVATWWDLPVPPGTEPGAESSLNERTVIFVGYSGGLTLRF